ncbi:MAG: septal ring lytic transglycosylase RlpA family protein [Acidobacteria bacterium]|nr:septal ring lytic transglycosylase RlpA family protein [Acidobacteriota bacterium]
MKRAAPPGEAFGSCVVLLALLLGSLGVGCAPRRPVARRAPVPPPAPLPPRRAPPPAIPGSYIEEGIASWYGVPFHGRRAADGEIFDMYKLTAAHRTLPFDSVVRVTNLKNGRTTEVRVIDRGPFVENRIVDLSLAAARELDMVTMGVALVRLELLAGPSSPLLGNFTVQVGAFLERENADRLRERLEQHYPPAFIQEYDAPNGLFYRVRVGRLPSQEAARQLAEQLRREEGFVPFLVRLDE